MKTAKQYKQLWLKYKAEHGKVTKDRIWDFQKTILSKEEARKSDEFSLYLEPSDPRHEIMDLTDKLFHKAPYS